MASGVTDSCQDVNYQLLRTVKLAGNTLCKRTICKGYCTQTGLSEIYLRIIKGQARGHYRSHPEVA